MKYLSIDIETTGVDARNNDVIEVGAIVDDLENPMSTKKLPTFHGYILPHEIVRLPGEREVEPFYRAAPGALALPGHHLMMQRINKKEKGFNYHKPNEFAKDLRDWLISHFPSNKMPQHAGGEVFVKSITPAGKNFGSFDLQFLLNMPNFKDSVRFRHRAIDVGSMYFKPSDEALPDLELCLERAGIPKTVKHTSVDDAMDVVKLVRLKQLLPRMLARDIALEIAFAIKDKYGMIEEISDQAQMQSPGYLKWACKQIVENHAKWDDDKTHRWVGWCQSMSNVIELSSIEDERQRVLRLRQTIQSKLVD